MRTYTATFEIKHPRKNSTFKQFTKTEEDFKSLADFRNWAYALRIHRTKPGASWKLLQITVENN